jgi:two-component system KDP operon response regulator KdpE
MTRILVVDDEPQMLRAIRVNLRARHYDVAVADDYVTEPFSIDELIGRIRAVTRRADPSETLPTVRIGDHLVDLATKTIRAAEQAASDKDPGADVCLTPAEWRLLETLLRNPGKLISQRQLLTDVWGPAYVGETHYLRQCMAQLRRRLEQDPARPCHFHTELGMGYRFQP